MTVNDFLRKLFLLLLLSASTFLSACHADDSRMVTLVGYNYTERPVASFRINDTYCDSILAGEGGKIQTKQAKVVSGQAAQLDWSYGATKAQYVDGLTFERHEARVTIPQPRTPDAHYLEIHFYPDHHVELALVEQPSPTRITGKDLQISPAEQARRAQSPERLQARLILHMLEDEFPEKFSGPEEARIQKIRNWLDKAPSHGAKTTNEQFVYCTAVLFTDGRFAEDSEIAGYLNGIGTRYPNFNKAIEAIPEEIWDRLDNNTGDDDTGDTE